ncbi:hypothetical protein [Helicobacter bilis]|uniref:hypothetical protein n=1 Tax=Helicobacter bilis TaxID=37372 RepID=UPI00248F2E4E|nr:hypothetical protein [Helicobacter bilis]
MGGGGNIVKETNMLNCMIEIQNPFYIRKNTICRLGDNKDYSKEYYHNAMSWREDSHQISFCNLIAFFCATKEGNYHTETLDYEALSKENIKISPQYSYNHILPPIEKYKKLIDEVLLHKDIVIEYLRRTGISILESQTNTTNKNATNNVSNTSQEARIKPPYFQRIAHKIKQRTNMSYLKRKLRKMFGVRFNIF